MIARFNGNVVPFADDATSTNRTVFGGVTQSDAIDDNLNADFKKGWEIVGLNDNPTREDFNAMGYTLGALISYLYEMGISEWNALQNYRVNSRVIGSDGNLYKSLTGTSGTPNAGNNPLSDVVNWELEFKNFVTLTGNQTIAGVKTFNSSPIVPTPTTGTQAVNKDYADLKVALSEFTGANQSLVGNGYQKLPGGLIIQWGYVPNIGGRQVAITFPIAFPNAFLNGSITTNNSSVATDNGSSVFAESKSGMAAALNSGYAFYWFAIGY